jgi:hypothetical protein
MIWAALSVTSESGAQKISKRQSVLAQEKEQQARELRRKSFKASRELLLNYGVPFDPDILLESDWKEKLAPALAVMPEFQEFREAPQKMEGVLLAHTLLLPESVELIGDTVIIARHVIFPGKTWVINGPHNFTFFPIEPLISLESSLATSAQRGSSQFVNAGSSIVISGKGRRSGDRQEYLSY